MHLLVIDKNMVRGACTRVDKEVPFWRRIRAYRHQLEVGRLQAFIMQRIDNERDSHNHQETHHQHSHVHMVGFYPGQT
ncbi:hypothetical protein D3C77_768080 [compost metagenome]